jgi:hypothetical protein
LVEETVHTETFGDPLSLTYAMLKMARSMVYIPETPLDLMFFSNLLISGRWRKVVPGKQA